MSWATSVRPWRDCLALCLPPSPNKTPCQSARPQSWVAYHGSLLRPMSHKGRPDPNALPDVPSPSAGAVARTIPSGRQPPCWCLTRFGVPWWPYRDTRVSHKQKQHAPSPSVRFIGAPGEGDIEGPVAAGGQPRPSRVVQKRRRKTQVFGTMMREGLNTHSP